MNQVDPYNPLDLEALGQSLLRHLERQPLHPLGAVERFSGSGVYALYYQGDGDPYGPIGRFNRPICKLPIYIGRAKDPGSRTGFDPLKQIDSPLLRERVQQHKKSIGSTENLQVADFAARLLVVMPIWIPLAEAMAIRRYRPLWNSQLQGFGIHAPGSGRSGQKRSQWDELHPGRVFAAGLKRNERATRSALLERMRGAVQDAVDGESVNPRQAGSVESSEPQPGPNSPARHSRSAASPRPKRR